MSAKPALEPTLRALVARDRRGLGQHLTPEILIAYHAGELPGAEEEEIRDHLALCSECAELLLDLVSFAEFSPAAETAALADSEVESAWQKVQPQVVAPAAPPERRVLEMPGRKQPVVAGDGGYLVVPPRRLIQAYAMAATLLVGVVGLSMWGGNLRGQLQEKSKPKGDVVIARLVPEGEGSRGPEDVKPIPIGRSLVVLELLNRPPETEYGVELFDNAKRSVWTSAPLHRFAEDDVVTFELPPGLPPGNYEAQLFSAKNGNRKPLTVYRVPVAGPAGR